MRDLALTLLESYAKMEEQDMCEVDVSVDMFHEAVPQTMTTRKF